MSEKFRVNTNPDQAGVRRDVTAAVSERTGKGLLIPIVLALMGMVLFVVLFSRFGPGGTGTDASNLAAAQAGKMRQAQENNPAANPNGMYPAER